VLQPEKLTVILFDDLDSEEVDVSARMREAAGETAAGWRMRRLTCSSACRLACVFSVIRSSIIPSAVSDVIDMMQT
jgi:hypothetical protein